MDLGGLLGRQRERMRCRMNIYEILDEIEKAYPEDIFPDTTEREREDVKERYPGFIDRTSAMMGRHLAQVIRRKLAEVEDDEYNGEGLA
jgi:hypothetical protein